MLVPPVPDRRPPMSNFRSANDVSGNPEESWIGSFREQLLDWFSTEAREYPWRGGSDPYAILVSELMLQQTQIATVLSKGYFQRWMEKFPDWQSLADAEEGEVLKVWEGLGYYSRARNLQRAARVVIGGHGGVFPRHWDQVLKIPGVGPYTAGAVLSIAYGLRFPVVDGNVARVLARVFALAEPVNGAAGSRRLRDWATLLVPPDRPGDFNAALMELGQRICRPANPECAACPLANLCRARHEGTIGDYPVKKPAPGVTRIVEHVVLARRAGKVFLCPETGSRRRGLWRLPESREEDVADLEELISFDYVITRYRVRLRVFAASPAWEPLRGGIPEGGWFSVSDPASWPALGSPYRKVLDRL